MNRPVLLIPEKKDTELEQVAEAWLNLGGSVKRLGRYWISDEEVSKRPVAIYGGQAFALVVAQMYNVELISPDDTMIARLHNKWTQRLITITQIDKLTVADFPVFIKPVIPKSFIAGVFYNLTDFQKATEGLPAGEAVLVSSIVNGITAEARGFIKNGVVKDIAVYEGTADLATADTFLADFANQHKAILPSVVVTDLAYSELTGWFVLEFNACWGAGLNNCSAGKVIDCIISASRHI